MNFAVMLQACGRPAGPVAALLLAALLALAGRAGGCAQTHPVPDDGGGIGPIGPPPPSPIGQWRSSSTGNFQVLKATGIDHFTLVFQDKLRPRLDMRLDGTQQFTARGSQTNTSLQETVDYTFNGSYGSSSLNGTLHIVRRRSTSGTVFSTQIINVVALKQRHDTASLGLAGGQ